MLIVNVLACDYGKTRHELGSQSIMRLRGAMSAHAHEKSDVQFVFAAGKLSPKDARLCDLQKAHVEREGFRAEVAGPEHGLIWGSKAELRFLKRWLKANSQQSHDEVEVWTADYHRLRVKMLGWVKARLFEASYRAVDSSADPPSLRARVHEYFGLFEAIVPDFVMEGPKAFRRLCLKTGRITY